MYRDILIPTDGSAASETALEQGTELASSVDATVHLLHVVDIGTEMSASGIGEIAGELTETLDDEAREAIEEAEEMADEAGVSSERAILEGVPEDVIQEYSAESGIDLVVVGESEDSTIPEQLFGSTTDDVLQTTTESVLVARE